MRWLWTLALGLTLLSLIHTGALADKRVALVIGNGAYAHAAHLPNPPHDAEDVAAALKRTGFDTILGTDLDQAGMQDAAIRFARAARTADVAVFYYSGHAMQYAGVNYLIPIDAKLSDEADLRRMARVDEILADLQQAKNLRILVLDSCRDNPLAEQMKRAIGATRAVSIQRGLAKIDSPEGMIVSYATQAGHTAEDGNGRNSPYTAAFLKHIEEQDEIGAIFRRIAPPTCTKALVASSFLNCRFPSSANSISAAEWTSLFLSDLPRLIPAPPPVYRLLTESEWEYAARAKTEPGAYPMYWFGNDEKDLCRYGNVLDRTWKTLKRIKLRMVPCNDGYAFTSPVGSFAANNFGLYDVLGNAWTWTEDCYHGNYIGAPSDGSAWTSGDCNNRVLRGASWVDGSSFFRAARRFGWYSIGRASNLGVRVVRVLTP